MPQSVTNIVFGKFAENVLQAALRNVGRHEDIIVFPDDLSFGPINPLSGATRQQWIRKNFYLKPSEWNIFPGQLKNFFQKLNSQISSIVCWTCSNSIYEYCGFCECICHLTVNNVLYVETMDAEQFENPGNEGEDFPPRLAHISPLIASRLIGKEMPVSTSLRTERLQIWQRLCTENAPLRSIGPQGVESVPISYFDPFLLAFVETNWRSARLIVTRAAVEANSDSFFRVDMIALTGRLRALVKEGRIEADQDMASASVNVRLP